MKIHLHILNVSNINIKVSKCIHDKHIPILINAVRNSGIPVPNFLSTQVHGIIGAHTQLTICNTPRKEAANTRVGKGFPIHAVPQSPGLVTSERRGRVDAFSHPSHYFNLHPDDIAYQSERLSKWNPIRIRYQLQIFPTAPVTVLQ